MSIDEQVVVKVVEAAARVRLDCVLIGNVAAILQDVPVLPILKDTLRCQKAMEREKSK